ncbi:MAG: hypothetical protein GF365_02505 [Candidatus Buchananbacteria bacterium]|nr:hypothetical protein [Candidatus Buchananbacteria bacterium]
MGSKKKSKTKLKIVEKELTVQEFIMLLPDYKGKTLEIVTHATFSGEIVKIEIINNNFFIIYYKNVFVYKENQGWVFQSEDELTFKVEIGQVKILDKEQGTIQIKFNEQVSLYLKQIPPKQIKNGR